MSSNIIVVVIAGFPFVFIAAMFVFLLSYREYSHHFSDRRMSIKLSLESALFTLVFFGILLVVLGFVLSKMFS